MEKYALFFLTIMNKHTNENSNIKNVELFSILKSNKICISNKLEINLSLTKKCY